MTDRRRYGNGGDGPVKGHIVVTQHETVEPVGGGYKRYSGWCAYTIADSGSSISPLIDTASFPDALEAAMAAFQEGGFSWPQVWGDRP